MTKFYSARELHQYLSRARRWRTRRLYTHRQLSRTGWRAVLGEKNDVTNAYDDETNSYMVMFFTTLRNLKPLVMDAYRTKNSLPRKWRDSVSKLGKVTEERKIVICRACKDGKIVILKLQRLQRYIMTKELQQFEKMDLLVDGCGAYLHKMRKDCKDLATELHTMGAMSDEMLLHAANGASTKSFQWNTPAYPYLLFTVHQSTPKSLLNVDI